MWGWQGNRKRAMNVVNKTAGYRPSSGNWRINENKTKLPCVLVKGDVRTATTGCSLASGSHRSAAECWRLCSGISQGCSVNSTWRSIQPQRVDTWHQHMFVRCLWCYTSAFGYGILHMTHAVISLFQFHILQWDDDDDDDNDQQTNWEDPNYKDLTIKIQRTWNIKRSDTSNKRSERNRLEVTQTAPKWRTGKARHSERTTNSNTAHCTHTQTAGSADEKTQNIFNVRNNKTAATLHTLKNWFV